MSAVDTLVAEFLKSNLSVDGADDRLLLDLNIVSASCAAEVLPNKLVRPLIVAAELFWSYDDDKAALIPVSAIVAGLFYDFGRVNRINQIKAGIRSIAENVLT